MTVATIEINNEDFNDLVFWSFRYVLGRKTYAVGNVVDIIIRNASKLTDETRNNIAREITRAINAHDAGMACDAEDWSAVKGALETDIIKSIITKSDY